VLRESGIDNVSYLGPPPDPPIRSSIARDDTVSTVKNVPAVFFPLENDEVRTKARCPSAT